MSSRRGVPLHYGYALRLAALLTPVGIAEDFTLGDLSRSIDDFDEIDMVTLSALHSDISYREWQHEQRGST
jgi:hypothetical protein